MPQRADVQPRRSRTVGGRDNWLAMAEGAVDSDDTHLSARIKPRGASLPDLTHPVIDLAHVPTSKAKAAVTSDRTAALMSRAPDAC